MTKIENWYRVIKERDRCSCAMLLFNYMPRMMVVQLMKTVVFHANDFFGSMECNRLFHP